MKTACKAHIRAQPGDSGLLGMEVAGLPTHQTNRWEEDHLMGLDAWGDEADDS